MPKLMSLVYVYFHNPIHYEAALETIAEVWDGTLNMSTMPLAEQFSDIGERMAGTACKFGHAIGMEAILRTDTLPMQPAGHA